MNKYKVIAFFGPSASGKDTLAKQVCSTFPDHTNFITSHTTRPPRDYEVHGKDYYFVSEKEFTRMVLNYELMEAASYREWFYGTSYKALDPNRTNIGVFNLQGMNAIVEDPKLEVLPIYVRADDKVRLLRSLHREVSPDCDEICRRFQADKKEFSDIDFYYISLDNNNEGVAIDFDTWPGNEIKAWCTKVKVD